MTARRTAAIASIVTLAIAAWYVLFIGLPRWTAPKPPVVPPPEAHTEPAAKIRARLFYLAEDGLRLEAVETEVPFGDGTMEQGRQLVLALLNPPPSPLVSTIPQGTTLRSAVLRGGTLRVDVSDELLQLSGDTLVDAIAQLVFTASEIDGVRSVKIVVEGADQQWPAGNGQLQSAPLTVYDFPGLVPSAQPSYPAMPAPDTTTV